jgi:hypothetical protein
LISRAFQRRLFVTVAAVAGRVFLLVLVTAYEATTYYTGASANQGTFAAAYKAPEYGTTGTAYGRTFGFAAPALGLILSLGYCASQQEKGQQESEDF